MKVTTPGAAKYQARSPPKEVGTLDGDEVEDRHLAGAREVQEENHEDLDADRGRKSVECRRRRAPGGVLEETHGRPPGVPMFRSTASRAPSGSAAPECSNPDPAAKRTSLLVVGPDLLGPLQPLGDLARAEEYPEALPEVHRRRPVELGGRLEVASLQRRFPLRSQRLWSIRSS